jgi:sulfhydrogenase subunit beta (sulfur reductase)
MSRDDRRLLKKDRLEGFLESLLQDHSIFGPVKKGDQLLLDRIESVRDLVLGRGNTVNSAKGFLFPQTERLFAYHRGEAGMEIDGPSTEDRGLLLFGVRPCDARGLFLLDKVFGGTQQDPYYGDKRARTAVIGMACETPDPSCFCLSLGGGPCSVDGSDLLLLDIGDGFLAQAGSAKGSALLRDGAFEDADKEAIDQAERIEKQAEASMSRAALGQAGVAEALETRLEALFDDPIWDTLTESCLSCGICTYLCPTCHCFDILDEAGPSTGERIRVWDSCQFPLFTRQASGANPRPSAKERLRQRIMHKFCYLPKNGNQTGCVGCGRCVTKCPVNLDIREVVQRLSSDEAK